MRIPMEEIRCDRCGKKCDDNYVTIAGGELRIWFSELCKKCSIVTLKSLSVIKGDHLIRKAEVRERIANRLDSLEIKGDDNA